LPLKKIQASQRWKRTEPFRRKYNLKKGRLLDIGCGHGLFLSRGRASGWTAIGIDYPSIATHYAREKLDLQVMEGDLRTIILEDHPQISQFDLVTAWHCLEHDREPLSYLKGIVKVLAPNGKILLAVPNAGSLGMKTNHEEWVWCQQPYVHIYHFTQKSISFLAKQAGLRVLEMWTRNTWDANPAFDVYVGKYILKICKLLRCISYRASFFVEEIARLLCYGISCYKHWLFGTERKDALGSELLVLMELSSSKE
jgi:2-polyprenyl-3-methyl-5-hydroxy-6-metoxy-1,4-benzoquinol methylase